MSSITDIQLEVKDITSKLKNLYAELEDLKSKDVNVNKIDFEKMKSLAKTYPIKDHPLRHMDEYSQKLYLTMLACIAQFDTNNIEDKLRFIQRIICGSNIKIKIEDISKAALQINGKLMDEFNIALSSSGLSINFAVDIMLVANLSGKCEDHVLDYISSLFEVIKLSKKDIQFVIKMSKAILMQDAEIYEDILTDPSIAVKLVSFKMYTADISKDRYDYYIIENSLNKIVVKSKEKVVFNCNLQELLNGKSDVALENLIINLNSATQLNFEENHKVTFKNCEFIGDGGDKYLTLEFITCKMVRIESCIFQNIKTPQGMLLGVLPLNRGIDLIYINNVVVINVTNNKMIKCDVYGNYSGGSCESPHIIKIVNLKNQEIKNSVIKNNEFIECTGDKINC
ncbi:hypothetical protein [Acetoanaerobium noterae]|uniref:hypothetical protein n=1 Tax=Acetoanaerobium noterae TaxID=745369 RepID=UPI00331DE18C